MKTRIPPVLITFALACFALAQNTRAVTPAPDGGYSGANTAEGGSGTLFSLTTGTNNTALGSQALFSVTTGSQNTATGVQALKNNTANGNTADGFQALVRNTTGSNNTATGWRALFQNTIGGANTAVGSQALFSNTTGIDNTGTGFKALYSNTTGVGNTAMGQIALLSNTAGINNTAIGFNSLGGGTTGSNNTGIGTGAGAFVFGDNNTVTGSGALAKGGDNNTADGSNALGSDNTGDDNTAIGAGALGNFGFLSVSGSGNTALGSGAGANLYRGDNNIYVGNPGVDADSGTVRIGTAGTQTQTFIAGISGTAVTGTAVVVSSTGQLGVAASSARFKDEIKPMDKASETILALKPVTFRYKPEIDPKRAPQFGLVAEEVEKVNPDLVVRDKEGKPYTVRYDQVNAMLLNEFLKEHRKVQEQEATITQLKKDFGVTIVQLTARLDEQASQIQKVSTQLQVNKPAPQVVNTP